MPHKKFIEEYPLYRTFKYEGIPATLDHLPDVSINMFCFHCSSKQTFVMMNKYHENYASPHTSVEGVIFRMVYRCAHCRDFERTFFIQIDQLRNWMMKVGQFPAWDIECDPNLKRLLGKYSTYYKRGLTCESQGFGIGAFGYYRRVVEEIIDELLNQISELLEGEGLDRYKEALQKTKETTVTQGKIELVKDLLPPILRPGGMNPLSTLHSALSAGLHADSEEAAETCREALVFLVNQVASSKEQSKTFTERMRKLLERKSKKSS
jgi:hypothetical protein